MEGKAVAWLKHMAGKTGADITGTLMIADQGRYYNRLVWSRPDGRLFTYDKKHLFSYAGEDKVYTAGHRRLTVELKGWRIRPFICFDLRFPIWCRNLDNAYDLAVFTANWPSQRSSYWRTLLRARAIENQSFVMGVNRVGKDGNGLSYSGDSALIDPKGIALYEVKELEDCRPLCLNKQKLVDCRKRFPFFKDADRDMVRDET
jgi:predicted amidohydrolase